MSKVNFYKYVIFGLMFTNIILIAALVLGRPPHHRPPSGPQERIIEKLQLDDVQQRQFKLLIGHHKSALDEADKKLQTKKVQLYKELAVADSKNLESLKEALMQEYELIEQLNITHFSDLKKILREDQVPYFADLMKEIPRTFFKKNNKPQRPKK